MLYIGIVSSSINNNNKSSQKQLSFKNTKKAKTKGNVTSETLKGRF
jgi:hypothetical protein